MVDMVSEISGLKTLMTTPLVDCLAPILFIVKVFFFMKGLFFKLAVCDQYIQLQSGISYDFIGGLYLGLHICN